MLYNDHLKIKDALQIYFSKYHFENGGYDLKWFKIKLGPIYIPFPNTKSRIAAVKIHDIHHLVTEYPAIMRGEVEIGAWEIASGCGNYFMAWILNAGSFLIGIFFWPKALFNAFLRGRKCKTNLYYNVNYNSGLLEKTVGELRNDIGIDVAVKSTFNDYIYFIFWCLIALSPIIFFMFLMCKILHI